MFIVIINVNNCSNTKLFAIKNELSSYNYPFRRRYVKVSRQLSLQKLFQRMLASMTWHTSRRKRSFQYSSMSIVRYSLTYGIIPVFSSKTKLQHCTLLSCQTNEKLLAHGQQKTSSNLLPNPSPEILPVHPFVLFITSAFKSDGWYRMRFPSQSILLANLNIFLLKMVDANYNRMFRWIPVFTIHKINPKKWWFSTPS